MRHSRASLAAVSFLVAGALGAQPGSQGPPPAPVEVVAAERTEMRSLTWVPGTVVSRNDARIAAEAAGRLDWVVEVGDVVEKGAPLARIDDAALRLQLRTNEAQIKRLEAELRFVDQQLERRRRLAEQQIISANDLEETVSRRETAVQNLESARVTREQTEFWISRCTVRAPFTGKVVERLQQPGGHTSAGEEVVRLVNVDQVEVSARAPLSVEPFLTEGLTVEIEGRGRVGSGSIKRIVRVGDERSRLFEVRVRLEGDPWVVGSAVKVALPSSDPKEVVAVPRDALILRSDAIYVFRVGEDGTAERLSVETGIGDRKKIEIVGAVEPGDRVVVRGGERLRPGQAVLVQ